MTEFVCTRCNHTGRYSARYSVHRCGYCGTAHHVPTGGAIPPELLPICEPGRVSPWHDARYRPYREGVFECEFRDGVRLRLRWNGRAWTWCALVVDTVSMVKWRGTWGESK